jgi:hypothetical protein
MREIKELTTSSKRFWARNSKCKVTHENQCDLLPVLLVRNNGEEDRLIASKPVHFVHKKMAGRATICDSSFQQHQTTVTSRHGLACAAAA